MPVCLAVGCSNTSGKKWKWITQYCWSSGYTTWVAKIFPPVLSVLYSCHHINLMSRCLLHVLLIHSFSSRLQPALFYPLGCTTPGTLTSWCLVKWLCFSLTESDADNINLGYKRLKSNMVFTDWHTCVTWTMGCLCLYRTQLSWNTHVYVSTYHSKAASTESFPALTASWQSPNSNPMDIRHTIKSSMLWNNYDSTWSICEGNTSS